MDLFSTVLFIDGQPVGYQLSAEEQNKIMLNPAENPSRGFLPPVMSARQEGDTWKVEGTENQDLMDQVLKDITRNTHLSFSRYSAAP